MDNKVSKATKRTTNGSGKEIHWYSRSLLQQCAPKMTSIHTVATRIMEVQAPLVRHGR
jgi:hypothetical protein